jgi:hypothetical protein
MSGNKQIGCCVHVATLIYYLAIIKYSQTKLPAEHLNLIFLKTGESPNSPKYLRNKRISKHNDLNSNNFEDFSEFDSSAKKKKKINGSDRYERNIIEESVASANIVSLNQFKTHIPTGVVKFKLMEKLLNLLIRAQSIIFYCHYGTFQK